MQVISLTSCTSFFATALAPRKTVQNLLEAIYLRLPSSEDCSTESYSSHVWIGQ